MPLFYTYIYTANNTITRWTPVCLPKKFCRLLTLSDVVVFTFMGSYYFHTDLNQFYYLTKWRIFFRLLYFIYFLHKICARPLSRPVSAALFRCIFYVYVCMSILICCHCTVLFYSFQTETLFVSFALLHSCIYRYIKMHITKNCTSYTFLNTHNWAILRI